MTHPILARADAYAMAARVLAMRAGRHPKGSPERAAIMGESWFMRSRARDFEALAALATKDITITREI